MHQVRSPIPNGDFSRGLNFKTSSFVKKPGLHFLTVPVGVSLLLCYAWFILCLCERILVLKVSVFYAAGDMPACISKILGI